ncbi:hypothetical protein GCM10017600_45500 [Streptosporangium carneum]|uniref:Uncharacterized protein n=1 Tax=Streptosporangium carneum TaxID=47481 RepID=A0A9W6I4P0_9ACTN|nr:hypothetical protein GCM10017600_45500 [Streptosporangium carneum]
MSDLVQQPSGAVKQGDPPPHRRGQDLPGRAAIIQLVGTVLAEQTDEWTEGHRYMGLDILAKCRTCVLVGDTPTRNPIPQKLTN